MIEIPIITHTAEQEALEALARDYSHLDYGSYSKYPGVTDRNFRKMMGHDRGVGFFAVNSISSKAGILSPPDSLDAVALSKIYKKPTVLVEVAPKPLVDLAIIGLAKVLHPLLQQPGEKVVSSILTGGTYLFDRLVSHVPYLNELDRQDIHIVRTKDGQLVKPYFTQDFIHIPTGAHVILIDDLGDELKTVRKAVRRAYKLGAGKVSVFLGYNKIGVRKVYVAEICGVGVGVKGTGWYAGVGADAVQGIGRTLEGIYEKQDEDEWFRFVESQNVTLGSAAIGLAGGA